MSRRGFWPKLIACDLDGTLLRTDFTVSGYTRSVLREVADRGVPFVIATGRSIGTWLPTASRLPVLSPVVCASGAVIVEPDGSRTLAEWPITPANLAAGISALSRAYPDAAFGVERGVELAYEPRYRPTVWAPRRLARQVDSEELHAVPAHLLRIQTTVTDAHCLPAADGTGLTVMASSPTTAEAIKPNASKANAVAWLAEQHGIYADEVLAFGDLINDVALLRWAGVGVAVANAHPLARAAATEMTASCDDDGVARYLDRLLQERPRTHGSR